MPAVERKSFGAPDEVRPMADKGRVEIVKMTGGVVGKATFEPGWRWSEHVKPITGTASCQAHHLGYVLSGRQVIEIDDGSKSELGPAMWSTSHPATTGGWRAMSPASSSTSLAWRHTPRPDAGRVWPSL